MDWLYVAWSWWEGAAPLLGLVEFGLLIVGTLWTWCYRRTLKAQIEELRAYNASLTTYLVNKLGPDEKNAARISGKGSAKFAPPPPARLSRGAISSAQGDQGRE